MINSLWGRITGKDKRLKFPEQQVVSVGRTGDYVILFPYGMYCDVPAGVMTTEIGNGAVIPLTVTRPSDTEQGEPVFFHPATNTRIIFRNNGDIDVFSKNVNIIAEAGMNITTPTMTINGNLDIIGNIESTGGIMSNGKNISDTHTHIGSPTAPVGAISNTGGVV